MARRAQIAAAIAFAVAAFMQLAPAGQGAAKSKVKSSVSLQINANVYSGKVTSREYGCEARRPIRLIVVQPGRDQKLANVVTDAHGRYEARVLNVKKGTLVKAKARRVLESDFECAPAASRVEQTPLGEVTEVASSMTLQVRDGRAFGRVGSGQAACRPHRTVLVKTVRRGSDGELDRTGTDRTGRWSVKLGSLRDRTRLRATVTEGFTPEFTCLTAASPVRVYREPKKP